MNSISTVLQGNEQTLFSRVLNQLQLSGCSRRYIQLFEAHKDDYQKGRIDELIELSEGYLEALGYWK